MSILSEPRKPDCDVCEWATAHHFAHGLNLCGADLDLANKVAQQERERIIKLLEEQVEKWDLITEGEPSQSLTTGSV